MLTLTLQNEQDTDRLGAALAEVLPPGTVVALIGTLGAGKTRLVQAVAAALGVPREAVTSPTFVLVNEYRQGRVPIFHFDTYRLKDDDEFLALGPEEYFDSAGITFIEWADRVADLLPPDRLEITLEVTGDTSRRATIAGTGPHLAEAIARIRSTVDGLRG
jgi:tRNA threonylcarbamoyladenosine biosynthesis protein TsaE